MAPRLAGGSMTDVENGGQARLHGLNAQVDADLPAEDVAELRVSRHGRPSAGSWIYPPGMAASLPKQLTAVVAQVKQQIAALHAEMGTSSKSRPAASFSA